MTRAATTVSLTVEANVFKTKRMPDLSRRAVLVGSSAALLAATGAHAQSAPRYDLLIKGGEVLDPSQGLRGSATWPSRLIP